MPVSEHGNVQGWTLVECPDCGASWTHMAEQLAWCQANCKSDPTAVDVVRADYAERLRAALREAIKLARDFNRGAMTWQEYDRKLADLEAQYAG